MKKILFVCVENSSRSQMAEGFAKTLGEGLVLAYSAGSRASGVVNANAIKAMKEAGIDISYHTSKGFNDLPTKEFDYAVTLGCKDTCPFIPADQHISWQIEDPKGKDFSFFIKTRDQINKKVIELIKTLSEENA